jgi:hypothetical protein
MEKSRMTQDEMPVDRFRALLTAFCSAHQIPIGGQTLGVEFEADSYRVLIASDPRDTERILVDVVVAALDEPSLDFLMALHQLNHHARIEHDWVASIDLSDRLCLHTQRSLASLRVEDIDSILAEGINRAEALETLCKTLAEPPEATEDLAGGDPGAPGLVIRG